MPGADADGALLGERRADTERRHDDKLRGIPAQPVDGRLEQTLERQIELVVGPKQRRRADERVAGRRHRAPTPKNRPAPPLRTP